MELKPCPWLRRVARPSIVITWWLGIAFLLSGSERLSSEAYQAIVAVGGRPVWASVFLATSLFLIYGSHHSVKVLRIAHAAAGTCFLALAIAFACAAVRYDVANLTAPAAYGGLAYFQFFVVNELGKPENLRWVKIATNRSLRPP